VIDLVSASQIPIVGHNALLDLAYILHHFHHDRDAGVSSVSGLSLSPFPPSASASASASAPDSSSSRAAAATTASSTMHETFVAWKTRVHTHFPLIFDTKRIAQERHYQLADKTSLSQAVSRMNAMGSSAYTPIGKEEKKRERENNTRRRHLSQIVGESILVF
jgi:hypothetical protein